MTTKIAISQKTTIHLVDCNCIVYCQSNSCYTFVHLVDGEKYIVVKSLAKFAREELWFPEFIRVSQSYLVNRNYISSIDKKKKNVVLSNGHAITFTITIKELIALIYKQDL
jgi:two-component system LytT family response regulator